MAILPVVQLYQPNIFCPGSCLRQECESISEEDFSSAWFHQLIKDMFETLYNSSSGVGLSANQVGILKKISVIDLNRDAKKPLILVNPKIIPLVERKVESLEVCLSFPGISATVQRYQKVKLLYQDIQGNAQEIVAEGFRSNVFQHEVSHLYGCPHVDLVCHESDINSYGGTPKRKADIAYTRSTETNLK
ncbi:MAG: peptide deformylase [Clostridiales bacterium]|nr:peptide deformylase [Clostridiales bacterium]